MDLNISHQDRKLSSQYKSEIPNEIIEEQTKKIPNLVFFGMAMLGIIGSATLTFVSRKKELGNFVGLWVPTILTLGLYNKMVKLEDELLRKPKFDSLH